MTGIHSWETALAVLLTFALAAHGDAPVEPGVRVVAFSPDGRLLAAGTGEPQESGSVSVWDVAGRQVRFVHREKTGVPAVAFSPDGQTLAIGVYDKAARLLDVATGKVRITFAHAREVRAVAFSPDGQTLATACWDRTLRLWDVANGTVKRTLSGHQDRIFSVSFSPDGKWLLSAAGTDGAKLWDVATGVEKYTWKHGNSFVTRALFSPDGRWVLSAGFDATLRVWDVQTGEMRLKLQVLEGTDGLALTPATWTLATCGFGPNISLFELNLQEPTAKEQEHIRRLLAQLDDDAYEVREAAGKELREIGVPAEEQLRRAKKDSPSAEVRLQARRLRAQLLSRPEGVLTGASSRMEALAFSPDGKLLAGGAKDGIVRLWDVATRKEVAHFAPRKHATKSRGGQEGLQPSPGLVLQRFGSLGEPVAVPSCQRLSPLYR
ncbi:MAG: WD40 repeat domain-containing protein [Planctomycetes bacterium]|nr:WD40 repeat domain-containing protein [Planctomycetota bacterium]